MNVLYKFLFKKEVLFYFFSAAILIAFRTQFETLVSNTIVNYVFSNIKSTWYNDVIIGLISLGIFIWTRQKVEKYFPSYNTLILIFVSTFVYFLYRISGSTWIFTPFLFSSYINYFDILFVILGSQLVLFINRKHKKQFENSSNSFIEDVPITSDDKDKLGFSSYAEQIASKINDSNFKTSFAIGINGKWGYGKTSLINLINCKIEKENTIIINFKPWNSNNTELIITEFFSELQAKLNPYHSSLSRLFSQYSSKLASIGSNSIIDTILTINSIFNKANTTSKLFVEINKALVKIDKKLVIYIDDIDRLDKHEIIEIIRLIRKTANFHNTFYIVAYDRDYVVNALSNFNNHLPETFLEKIFQLEINLPRYNVRLLQKELADKLKSKLDSKLHSIIDDEIIGNYHTSPTYLMEWLENMRDVTRLSNSILLNYKNLLDEINFNNLLRIELLRIKFPSVYELLSKHTQSFLVAEPDSYGDHTYKLIKNSNKEDGKTNNTYKTYFELYLHLESKFLSIQTSSISKIVEFVNSIFGGGIQSKKIHWLSIIHPSKFDRYFSYQLVSTSLSEVEFSKSRAKNQKEFNNDIKRWIEDGKLKEVRSRLDMILEFDNKDDYEKIVNAIIFISKLTTPKVLNHSLLDFGVLFNLITKQVARKYYKDDSDYRYFINSILTNEESPYKIMPGFISFLEKAFEIENSIPFGSEELYKMNLKYFESYCNNVSKIDNNIYRLFFSSDKTVWKKSKNGGSTEIQVYTDEAKEIFKKFIFSKDLDGWISGAIELLKEEPNTYKISEVVFYLFSDLKSLLIELEKRELKSEYIEEFILFISQLVKQSSIGPIKFEFNVIPITKRN